MSQKDHPYATLSFDGEPHELTAENGHGLAILLGALRLRVDVHVYTSAEATSPQWVLGYMGFMAVWQEPVLTITGTIIEGWPREKYLGKFFIKLFDLSQRWRYAVSRDRSAVTFTRSDSGMYFRFVFRPQQPVV